jgi:hypothetical protein
LEGKHKVVRESISIKNRWERKFHKLIMDATEKVKERKRERLEKKTYKRNRCPIGKKKENVSGRETPHN